MSSVASLCLTTLQIKSSTDSSKLFFGGSAEECAPKLVQLLLEPSFFVVGGLKFSFMYICICVFDGCRSEISFYSARLSAFAPGCLLQYIPAMVLRCINHILASTTLSSITWTRSSKDSLSSSSKFMAPYMKSILYNINESSNAKMLRGYFWIIKM